MKKKYQMLTRDELEDELEEAGEAIRKMEAVVDAADVMGSWLSASLDDPEPCDEFKRDALAVLKALFDLRGCMDGTEVPE